MINAATYAHALFWSISETHPQDHDKVLDNFVKILAQNGHLGMHSDIEKIYMKLEMESAGIKQGEMTTARQVKSDKELLDKLNEFVSGKAELKQKVDENIIGGVILRADDTLIDASVLNSLNKLKKELTN